MIVELKRWGVGAAMGVALLATGSAAAHAGGGQPMAHAARALGHMTRMEAHATRVEGHAVRADAHAARALRATDTARLHYVSASGSELVEDGKATGTLPGSMSAHVNVGATLSGTFTINTRGGSITGHGQATPHGSGTYESFAGTVTVTGGTGRFAHARGQTGLYGTFDRDNYALVVQTTGTLSY